MWTGKNQNSIEGTDMSTIQDMPSTNNLIKGFSPNMHQSNEYGHAKSVMLINWLVKCMQKYIANVFIMYWIYINSSK
jgi:hypothetical protein